MNSIHPVWCALAAGTLLLGTNGSALAAACTAAASTAWNVQTTWGPSGTGCAGAPGGIPGSGDTVSIGVTGTPRAVTVPAGYTAQAASIAIGGTATNGISSLTLSAANSTLIVGGNLSVSAPNNNNTNALNVNAGTATVNGSITLNEGTTNARISRISVTTGTLAVNGTAGNNGDVTMNNSGGDSRTAIVVSGTGSVTITRSFILGSGLGTLTSAAGSTFTYTSGSAATAATGAAIAYRNLTINKSGGIASAATTGTLTVAGNLNIQAGTLSIPGINIAVTGTTSVTGTLNLTSATVTTKTFTGDVTIGGTWNNSGNTAIVMAGSLTNNGTFTSGTGDHTFQTTAAQQWAGSSGLTFGGNVIVNATRTNNTTTTINGVLTCDAALTNGDGVTGRTLTIGGNLAGKSSVTNSANSTLKIGGDATISTLTATATGNTVEYNSVGAQTVKNTAYYHLTISSGGTASLANDISVAGNLSDNGQLNAIAGNYVVTFNGNVAQSLLGAATNTTVYRLTINNTAALADRKVTASHDITVNNLLTFTSGRLVMSGTAKTVIPAGTNVSGAAGSPDNRYVAGRLQKFVSNGNHTETFDIGTDGAVEPAIGYSPATFVFSNVGGAGGSILAYATLNDHPNIATSTLDDTKSVNRYWTLTTIGVSGTAMGSLSSYDATFTFVNVAPPTDVDSGANTALFEVERWDGAAWNVTSPGTRTSTSTQALGMTAFSDFAVAQKKAGGGAVGGLNAMDTPTCAVSGVIKTKVSGIATSLNIVALNSTNTAIQTNFNDTVRVELMNASDNTGYPDANGCGPNWTVIQQLADVSFGPGDNGCKATSSFTENNVYRNVRVRITDNPGKPGEKIGCSGDNFAIRPQSLTVSAHDATWETAGTTRALANTSSSGGNVHKASTAAATTPRPFTLRVTPFPASSTNYDGSPTNVTGFPACGTLCTTAGTLTYAAGSWTSAGSGVRENSTANYSEAGTFNLQLEDTSFAAVDAADGTPDTCSNSSPFGLRACSAASVEIGRFVPDRFEFASANTPQLLSQGTATCGPRSFTYIGQAFWFAAGQRPMATINAANAAGAVTTNYPLDTSTSRPVISETYADATAPVNALLSTASVGTPPTISGAGTGTYTNAAGGLLSYTRNSPPPALPAPFNAAISLTVTGSDSTESSVSGNGTITTPTALVFNGSGSGIAFDGGDFDSGAGLTAGRTLVYGRLNVRNASGSQLVPLPVQMETQYWNGKSFVTNSRDNCTAIAASTTASNVRMSGFTSNLTESPCETALSGGGTFGSGRKTFLLSAPGSGNNGSVNLTVNLGSGAALGTTCRTIGVAPVADSGANLLFLQGNWTGGNYDQNPFARATFGIYPGAEEVIFIRESF